MIAPTPEELHRWVADLDCEQGPHVCGTCMACRARASSPDYERCPGSGVPRPTDSKCPDCEEPLYDTGEEVREDSAELPEHWRLREDEGASGGA